MPLAALRADLSAVLSSVEETHERVAITRNGNVVAVLIAPDDLETLEETLGWLNEEPYASAIKKISDAELVEPTIPLDVVMAELRDQRSA